ncbi:MAG: cytochrome c3 family protein, partial [Deltaproteobacteria bacterium]|nr:cytochrome c3 family protein [Deltaproteobacteria bacterium]
MKKIVMLVALVAFMAVSVVAFANPAAPAGDLTVAPMMKSDKKAPVTFSHAKHAAGVPDCKTCHHTWDGKAAPKKCSECHTGRKSGEKINSKDAGHKKCKACHKDMKKAKKATGP